MWHFEETRVLLFYFAAGQDEGHKKRIKKLSQQYTYWKKEFPEFEFIMIQEDALVFKQLNNKERAKIIWPFMSATSSLAYSEYMFLEQSDSPSFVLTGAEGNIIQRYSLEENTLKEIIGSVTGILSSAKGIF